jgi:hypothetical protein
MSTFEQIIFEINCIEVMRLHLSYTVQFYKLFLSATNCVYAYELQISFLHTCVMNFIDNGSSNTIFRCCVLCYETAQSGA